MSAENNSRSLRIKDMTAGDRPREKVLSHGVKSLTDAELLAILFSTGIQGKSVIEMSKEILDDNEGHLSRVVKMSVHDFVKRYKGIGRVKAITILSALELGLRAAADAAETAHENITTPEKAAAIMRSHLAGLDHEEFWVVLLNHGGRIIRKVCISQGGFSSTVVDVRIIMRHAIEQSASSMLLFHNHPSGTLTPSGQDDTLTHKIVEAAQLMDIRVLDHIIITDHNHYSYRDNGRM